jgi:hypothetical protein
LEATSVLLQTRVESLPADIKQSMTKTFVVDLQLNSREGVLMEAMNNETRGFRQVQAFLCIITLRHVCVVV